MIDKHKLCRCGDCQNEASIDDLVPLHDVAFILNRMDPGGEVPAGECRKCGSLSYPLYSPSGRVELRLDARHVLHIHRSDEGVVLDVWKDEGTEAAWSTYFFDHELMPEEE